MIKNALALALVLCKKVLALVLEGKVLVTKGKVLVLPWKNVAVLKKISWSWSWKKILDYITMSLTTSDALDISRRCSTQHLPFNQCSWLRLVSSNCYEVLRTRSKFEERACSFANPTALNWYQAQKILNKSLKHLCTLVYQLWLTIIVGSGHTHCGNVGVTDVKAHMLILFLTRAKLRSVFTSMATDRQSVNWPRVITDYQIWRNLLCIAFVPPTILTIWNKSDADIID